MVVVQANVPFYEEGKKSQAKIIRILSKSKPGSRFSLASHKKLNFQEIEVKVGYCQKIPKSDGLPGLGPIVESWTNDRLQICLVE